MTPTHLCVTFILMLSIFGQRCLSFSFFCIGIAKIVTPDVTAFKSTRCIIVLYSRLCCMDEYGGWMVAGWAQCFSQTSATLCASTAVSHMEWELAKVATEDYIWWSQVPVGTYWDAKAAIQEYVTTLNTYLQCFTSQSCKSTLVLWQLSYRSSWSCSVVVLDVLGLLGKPFRQIWKYLISCHLKLFVLFYTLDNMNLCFSKFIWKGLLMNICK